MSSDRMREKEQLLYGLGLLFSPVEELVTMEVPSRNQQLPRVLARFTSERKTLISEFDRFSKSEVGHDYENESHKFRRALMRFTRLVEEDPDGLKQIMDETLETAKAAIRSIPAAPESEILGAHTPFSTYCKIKLVFDLATERIILVDRYLDRTIFHRYLADVQKGVSVTLVGPLNAMTDEFLDLSRLFAYERGSQNYRLLAIERKSVHDRWLMHDDSLLHLGNSTAQAAVLNDFTITSVEPTVENMGRVNALVGRATELYGPNVQEHPVKRSNIQL